MRALGLLGFLIVIGVMVWIMSEAILPHTKAVIETQKKVDPQVKQMAGMDARGRDARDSIQLDAQKTNGKLKAVVVAQVTPGGAMETYYGLKKDDVIIEIAPAGGAFMPVSDMESTAAAKDQLLTSYQKSQQIIVLRDGKQLTLPVTKPGDEKPAESMQKQLDAIKIPTH